MVPAALACALVVAVLAACGDPQPVAPACLSADAGEVLAALQRVPERVALPGGMRISACVERALDDADLQAVGAPLTAAADALARQLAHGDRAAFRLGYLIGATERGASRSNGVAAELVARLRQAAGRVGTSGSRHAALLRGVAAGRRRG